jgi:hypothetical protein
VRRGVASAVWALAACAAALLALGVSGAASDTTGVLAPAPASSATLAELVQDVGGRGAAALPARYAYLHKIDSHLQDVAASRLGAGSAAGAAIAARRQGVTVSAQGDVLADVYVRGDVARAAGALRALGMRVTAVNDRAPQRLVEGYVPPEAIATAAELGITQAIVTPFARLRSGSFLSQGDEAINGPDARALGPTGAGVSVGIISDSINQVSPGISGSVSSGDLPADTVALSDAPGGTDEGRAMAEIVYDEAPGLDRIRFETADGGPVAKAHAIDALVADGAKVIADDTSYVAEPFFQDDVIAQAVDRAKAAGVAYFVSAGNDGLHGWGAAYSPVADPSGQSASSEDFDPGGAVDTRQRIGSFAADDEVTLVLQWAEPWGRAASDFAIDVYAPGGATPIRTIDTSNVVTGLPVEAQALKFAGPGTIEVAIRRVSGTGNPFLKLVAFTNGAGTVAIEHPAGAGAIDPGASSASGALTVAASDYATPETPEPFSSRGPVTHFFDANGDPLAVPEVRQKPDLAGPDNVLTSVPGFDQFQGTSAAAPAAAGIAALIRSAKPAMAIDELYAIMIDPANALDCLPPGNPDVDCGVGFVLADSALTMALDGTPPLVTASLSPAAPDGANGWYRVPVGVTWQISDPESPVVDPGGCGPVSLAASASLTCSATSAGGTTAAPLTVKIDPTPPSAPALTGIAAKTYLPRTLPAAKAIACSAGDPTSGVTGCRVTGYGSRFGTHQLIATATNGAGLTATSTLRYSVAKPLAISLLTLPKIGLGQLRASGLSLRVRIAAPSTRLVVRLVAFVPDATGSSIRPLMIGALSKSFPAGVATLRVKLTARAKAQLSVLARTRLKVTISARSARAKSASLTRSLVVRR